MPQTRIREDFVEGAEPLHRTAYLNDECVLTAFANPQEDRWIFGWRPAPWLDWKRIATFAAYTFLSADIKNLSSYVLRNDEFTRVELRHPTAAHEIVSDLKRDVREGDGLPDMMVLGTDHVQVELIFADSRPGALTLLTPIDLAPAFGPFVASTHAHDALVGRNRVSLVAQLFEQLFGPYQRQQRNEHGHAEGKWGEPLAGGQAKQDYSD